MPELQMSDDVFYTNGNLVTGLFNFLKDEITFEKMKVKFQDNNPLTFILVIMIDDLPELRMALVSYIFSDRYGYFEKILLAIKAKMASKA